MPTTDEIARWARHFGVADEQIRKDHFLSHLISGLVDVADDVVFFGGTALSRTHLSSSQWTRLSEDIDLLGVDDSPGLRARTARALEVSARREYGHLTWVRPLTSAAPPDAALVQSDEITVRVQLLPAAKGWRSWALLPSERQRVELRYADTPGSIMLRVPTAPAFAAMKLAAWQDRRSARDLFDLAALADLGAFGGEALAGFRTIVAHAPDPAAYDNPGAPFRARWRDELEHQSGELPDPAECLQAVRSAVERMLHEHGGRG